MKLLCDHGANINTHTTNGSTALLMAAEKGHESIVRLLCDHGADINAHNGYGETALMWAIIYRKESLVQWMCEHGADSNHYQRYELQHCCNMVLCDGLYQCACT